MQAAYDTIKQEKLLEIVDAVLTEVRCCAPYTVVRDDLADSGCVVQNSYWVQRYAQVTPALSKVDKKFKRLACPDGSSRPPLFARHARHR